MWPFKSNSTKKQQGLVAVPFPPDIADLPVLKYHAVRALCGVFMDRHSNCKSPHPFCGDISTTVVQLIANAVHQDSPNGPIMAIYLSKAVHPAPPEGEQIHPLDAAISIDYAEEIPYRKLVVMPVSNSNYYIASHGPILNPVEGNYVTGRIDPNATRTFYANPEPPHTKWQYWECELLNENITPEFRCLMVHGECWVVDADRVQGLVQQVAGLSMADNPEHNFGIFARENVIYTTNPRDNSEYAKVIRENCPVIGFPEVDPWWVS